MVSHHPDVVVILCSTYDAGDLPPEVATSGARAYLNKEHLGADTLRRLWERRDTDDIRLRLTADDSGPWRSLRPAARNRAPGSPSRSRTPSAPCRRSRRGGPPC